MSAVLITGATGLLGTEIKYSLLRERDETIYVLVRAEKKEAAIHRLKACWYPLKDLYNTIGTRILPAAGDVTEENLGISEELREILQEEVSTVIHAAAQVSLQKEEEELRKTNVEGTGKVIAFAESQRISQVREGQLSRISEATSKGMRKLRMGVVVHHNDNGWKLE